MKHEPNILIEDALILPMTSPERAECFTGSVGIEGHRIVFATDDKERIRTFRRRHEGDLHLIDGRGKGVMPGLVNTHCHVAMTLMRGYADDIPLMEWLHGKIWPFEALIDRDDVRLGAELGIAEMLLGGVTTFVDMYWYEEAVADAVCSMGIRAVLAPCFVDQRMEAFERDLPATLEKAHTCDRITVMIAPHAPYSCSPDNLRRAAELSRQHGLPVTLHLSETRDEVEQIRDRFGATPVEYIDRYGLLDRGTIAAHCVHLTDGDHARLREREVSVAHNPQSNMKISSGVAPVARMLDEGINVTVGTDGPCSNNDLDMWEELRSASFLAKLSEGNPCAVPAYTLLRMATVGGARAIGREHELGQIREGYLADLILLDLEKPHFYPRHDVVANLAYCAKSSDVDTVIVNGRIVVEGHTLLGVDVGALCRRVEERARTIVARQAGSTTEE